MSTIGLKILDKPINMENVINVNILNQYYSPMDYNEGLLISIL